MHYRCFVHLVTDHCNFTLYIRLFTIRMLIENDLNIGKSFDLLKCVCVVWWWWERISNHFMDAHLSTIYIRSSIWNGFSFVLDCCAKRGNVFRLVAFSLFFIEAIYFWIHSITGLMMVISSTNASSCLYTYGIHGIWMTVKFMESMC